MKLQVFAVLLMTTFVSQAMETDNQAAIYVKKYINPDWVKKYSDMGIAPKINHIFPNREFHKEAKHHYSQTADAIQNLKEIAPTISTNQLNTMQKINTEKMAGYLMSRDFASAGIIGTDLPLAMFTLGSIGGAMGLAFGRLTSEDKFFVGGLSLAALTLAGIQYNLRKGCRTVSLLVKHHHEISDVLNEELLNRKV